MEPYFVSTIGIRNICDHFIDLSKDESIPVLLKDGDSIYIPGPYVDKFVDKYLPNITTQFVLVSGGCDMTVPEECIPSYIKLIENPYFLCWFSQNATINTDKLKQIPIGIDYHTLFWNEYEPWGNKTSIENQEEQLVSIIQEFENQSIKKLNECYVNFHFNYQGSKYKEDRINALNNSCKDILYIQKDLMKRKETWENMVKFKYVLSPHGNGLDCHRTWEALALKCIPIIKSSPLDPLYKDLPIIIINNWTDVTPELLENYNSLNYNNYSEKLLLEYWKQQIKMYK